MSKQFINYDAFLELASLLDSENYPGGSRKSHRSTAIPSGKNISIIVLYNRSVKTIDSTSEIIKPVLNRIISTLDEE